MIQIINNDKKELEAFHNQFHGRSSIEITETILNNLLEGKLLAYNDGEYSTIIQLSKKLKGKINESSFISGHL